MEEIKCLNPWLFRASIDFRHCSYHESVPLWERCDLHIHWAFASDVALVKPGNGVISGQLRGKSAARLTDMQIQKHNADQDLDNQILSYDWPGLTCSGKKGFKKS